MRRFSYVPLLGMLYALVAPSCASAIGNCDKAVGDWSWFTGGVVSIGADGVLKFNGTPLGNWKCTDARRIVLSLHWNPTGYTDVVTLSPDGWKLSGKSSVGVDVWGTRMNQSEGPAVASQPTPARSAPAQTTRPTPGPSVAPASPPQITAPKQFHYDATTERLFEEGNFCHIATDEGCAQAYPTLMQAAQRGHARAQALLGNMFRGGHGVPKDLTKAAYWYEKAAAQGHRGAAFNLGDMYESGDGVRVDYRKASFYYDISARQGFGEAQFALGIEYEFGQGVPRNRQMAIFWLRQAAEQGDGLAHWTMDFLSIPSTPHFQTPRELGAWINQQVADWMHSSAPTGPVTSSSQGSTGGGCGQYTDAAACRAYQQGATWAADRLQNGESPPSEKSWYSP